MKFLLPTNGLLLQKCSDIMAEISVDIERAAQLLLAGQVVAIPTETVYGLAANALDPEAVRKIFEVKDRPIHNPLIIHISRREDLHKYVTQVPPLLEPLLSAFWPGPLTVLLDKNNVIGDEVNASLKQIAVRIPNHPLLLQLLDTVGKPLAAPSANPFGYLSPTRASHVEQQLGHKIPYILDGGPCSLGLESTIVGLSDNRLIVYRLGAITVEELAATYDGIVEIRNKDAHQPNAPGMLPYHYAPRTQLVLSTNVSADIDTHKDINMAVIHYTALHDRHLTHPQSKQLKMKGGYKKIAQSIYEILHELDQQGLDLIIVERFPDENLGRTLNDRLSRGAERRFHM